MLGLLKVEIRYYLPVILVLAAQTPSPILRFGDFWPQGEIQDSGPELGDELRNGGPAFWGHFMVWSLHKSKPGVDSSMLQGARESLKDVSLCSNGSRNQFK